MADCAMRAFRARVGATSPVSESQLMRLLSERLRMRDAAFFDKPLLWYSLTLSDWHKATAATGRFPASTPRAEAIARAATLLREDLTACCGSRQGAYKQLLADAALADFLSDECVCDNADDYELVSGECDPAALTAMLRLLGAARSAYIPADTADLLELRIHSRLAASPLLTPPDRLSHHLASTLLPALSAAS